MTTARSLMVPTCLGRLCRVPEVASSVHDVDYVRLGQGRSFSLAALCKPLSQLPKTHYIRFLFLQYARQA